MKEQTPMFSIRVVEVMGEETVVGMVDGICSELQSFRVQLSFQVDVEFAML